ncbi:MAG: cytochrome c oxidase subunit 4 [Thermomicrobia bacterium]|nr:cytochrome c oxidase subunit 4 [Thermomicrobia bacterium]
MPDLSSNTKKTAIKVAMGAALGGALGITAALRNKQAVGSGSKVVGSVDEAVAPEVQSAVVSRTQHSAFTTQPPDHPDWEPLPAAHLPRPTYWPVVLAVGVMFLAWGIVTTIAISIIGVILLALGIGGWIGELRHGD